MGRIFGSRDVLAGGYYPACSRSEFFNLDSTVSVQNLIFSAFNGTLFWLTVVIKSNERNF